MFEYWLGAKRSYLWRIARDDVRIWTLPSRERIEAEVDALRTAGCTAGLVNAGGDLRDFGWFLERVLRASPRLPAVSGGVARTTRWRRA